MTAEISCFDCRYFCPAQNGRAGYNTAVPMDTYHEGVSGFCHRNAPQHGRLLHQPNGDSVVGFAEWPNVFTHDWCGQFEPRASHMHHNQNNQSCNCCTEGEKNCE